MDRGPAAERQHGPLPGDRGHGRHRLLRHGAGGLSRERRPRRRAASRSRSSRPTPGNRPGGRRGCRDPAFGRGPGSTRSHRPCENEWHRTTGPRSTGARRGTGGDQEPGGVRPPDGRRARHPLRPAVVHRRARHPEDLLDHPRRTGERARRRDDLRRLRDRRLQPGAGERRPGPAGCEHLPAPPLARSRSRLVRSRARNGDEPEAEVARVFCDIVDLDGSPFQGCPRHVLRRTLDRPRPRLHLLRRAGDRVLLLRRQRPRPPPDDPRHAARTSS